MHEWFTDNPQFINDVKALANDNSDPKNVLLGAFYFEKKITLFMFNFHFLFFFQLKEYVFLNA